MSTLGERVHSRDRDRFVGRADELAFFDALLAGRTPFHVVHVVGIGGIGKSTLLREVCRRGRLEGFRDVWVEARDLSPFPDSLDDALQTAGAGADTERTIIVLDSYELIGSLDSHLRANVIPHLHDSAVVLIGSRVRPSRGWLEGGWDAIVHTIELGGLSVDECHTLAATFGLSDDRRRDVVADSHGSPLAVVMGAQAGGTGSMAELAARVLGDEVEGDRHRVLTVAALARVTTPELLADVLPEHDPFEAYKWLAERSFAEPLAEGVTLHALVAHAVRDAVRARDPHGEAVVRRRIADSLYQRAVAGRHTLSPDLQHLVVDQTVRWGYALDAASRHRIDRLRDGDLEYIGSLMRAVGADEWWAVSEALMRAIPEHAAVARDADGVVGGYCVAVSPSSAPAAADNDVLFGPWLHHARTVLRTNTAVLWREAVDLTGEMGEVTSLLGIAGMLRAGVPNPRYGYLPISPMLPAAQAFSEALGATHLPALDIDVHGHQLECHLVDFGPCGVLGFQRDWIYRETGAAPPSVVPDTTDMVQLVRALREPAGLADGPGWLGERPSTRLRHLQALVTEALVVFSDTDDDRLARSLIEAAYLADGAAHEAIARRFHLSRSAYFRRLQHATQRVAAELTARHSR